MGHYSLHHESRLALVQSSAKAGGEQLGLTTSGNFNVSPGSQERRLAV